MAISKPKILCVDDEPELLGIYSELLRSAGYEVLEASTGNECLSIANKECPDLILLDVNLPDINGSEVCRQIKADQAFTGTYVMLISGTETSSGKQVDGLEAGADAYITRPVATKELLARIRAMLRIRDAEHALRESAGRLRFLLKATPAVIYTCKVTPPYRATFISENMETQFGYKPEEFTEDSDFWAGHIHPDDTQRVLAEMPKLFEIGHHQQKYRFLHKDGSYRWMYDELNLIRGADGKPVEIVGSWIDITDNKRAEEALQQSEQRFRSLVENAPDVIFRLSPEGIITSLNPSFEKVTGFSSADFIGKNFLEAVHPEDRTVATEQFGHILGGNATLTFELHILTKSENYLKGEFRVIPELQEGKVVGVLGTARDVTERRQFEEEKEKLIGELEQLLTVISHSQREWQATFDSITDVIFLSDMDFNVIRVNRAVEKMVGIPLIQVLGRKCHELFHGTTFTPERCLGCQPLEKGKTASVEMFEPHLNKFIEIRVIPRFDGNDTLIGLIHVVRDITEQKELEDQLRHAQKMEAVGQLAGGIAHDFNNILTGIISCGSLLQMKLGTETPLKTYVDYILDASERGASLVRGLLAFSRKEMLYSSPVNLNEIITGVEPFIQKTITEDIGLRMALADEVLTIMADKTQIEQVLINLVANARDAMSAGGEITIHTERLNLGDDSAQVHGSLKPGVYAFMSVSDTGTGMDEKTRERIFEPFFTTKEVGKGTGLGLSIVYGIVKQHEGFISVDSLPGRGTTVKIYLPLIPTDLKRREEEESVLPEGGTETLLFAEDDAGVRGIVTNLLEEFGYAVIAAVDGDDAVKKFIEHQDTICLLVLDVIMPKMNGKEAYEKIKEIRPDVKTLFMSGYTSDILESKFILEDGLHFLQKPVAPANLLRKIREVLDA